MSRIATGVALIAAFVCTCGALAAPELKSIFNGKDFTGWAVPDNAIEEGPLGLQLHPGRVMHIDFRNIKLAELE